MIDDELIMTMIMIIIMVINVNVFVCVCFKHIMYRMTKGCWDVMYIFSGIMKIKLSIMTVKIIWH